MPQFEVSSFVSQLFWLSVTFSILYCIISKFIAPLAESILSNRDRYLTDNLNSAEKLNAEGLSIKYSLEKELAELKQHIIDMRKEENSQIEAKFIIQKKDLNIELRHKSVKEQGNISAFLQDFHINEADATVELASFIIEKITGNAVDMDLLKKIYKKA